jgi:hypothetical protein
MLERNRTEVAEWFGNGRTWRVCTELDGHAELEGLGGADFDHGHFTLSQPWAYRTPLGHRGTSGVVVQEVVDGTDLEGSRAAFGLQQLIRANRQYPGCVTGL